MKLLLSPAETDQYSILNKLYINNAHIKWINAYSTDYKYSPVNEIMQRLERYGYVEMIFNPKDGTIFMVKITPLGAEIVKNRQDVELMKRQNKCIIKITVASVVIALLTLLITVMFHFL